MNNILSMLPQLQQNPLQMLTQRGFKIPNGMNDPQQIIKHLMNTGQVSQEQYNNAMRAFNQYR